MKILKKFLGVISLSLGLVFSTVGAYAQHNNYPDKPIKMVVPFPPGGPTDLVARAIANELSKQLNQTLVVENKAGANGTVGTAAVAKATPDGYTILYNTSSLTLSPALYNKLGFDPIKDFEAVSSTANIPLVLLVHPKTGISSFEGLLQKLKSNDSKITYGSAGLGNITHLGSALFLDQIKSNPLHVPYKGSAPAMVDLVGGQFDFMMNTLNDSLSFINDKKLLALAVTSKTPQEDMLPGIRTLSEYLGTDLSLGAWQGIVVPKGTPIQIVEKLNVAVNMALQTDSFKALAKKQGFEILGGNSESYQKFIASEVKRWDDIVKKINLPKN